MIFHGLYFIMPERLVLSVSDTLEDCCVHPMGRYLPKKRRKKSGESCVALALNHGSYMLSITIQMPPAQLKLDPRHYIIFLTACVPPNGNERSQKQKAKILSKINVEL
jgi:hypothetical protein